MHITAHTYTINYNDIIYVQTVQNMYSPTCFTQTYTPQLHTKTTIQVFAYSG